jgi:hypothetical protein
VTEHKTRVRSRHTPAGMHACGSQISIKKTWLLKRSRHVADQVTVSYNEYL